ncbi:uncharacterized protein FOMMEDRAFT_159427 [Fomitiporia mediterranea MF3/22]|uniref:uncharacterized protein n=1 Tax=Fomitiporia mediterranea (strain MF3/22) TaxID=694068 RepID=UPI0004409908|nr:uncharacterized protein FOMMEDRAFT_159427 [Fomitiporia mediterranea MF3/22]EJD00660.1 hypothetical protein FOMMEDRAFT_159427 [Fomitiporia mediterranea MF3/22]
MSTLPIVRKLSQGKEFTIFADGPITITVALASIMLPMRGRRAMLNIQGASFNSRVPAGSNIDVVLFSDTPRRSALESVVAQQSAKPPGQNISRRYSSSSRDASHHPTADVSTIVSIKLLHKSVIPFRDDVCIGSIDIEASKLSGRCMNGPSGVLFILSSMLAYHELIPAHLPLDATVCGYKAVAEVQFREPLMEPLKATKDKVDGPIVIILDALDDDEFGKLPSNFQFFITSRPEDDIITALSDRPNSAYEINLDARYADSKRDVLRYIDYKMSRIIENSLIIIPDIWRLFIWASTAVKIVSESSSKFRKLNELVNTSDRLKGLVKLYASALRDSGVITMSDKVFDLLE